MINIIYNIYYIISHIKSIIIGWFKYLVKWHTSEEDSRREICKNCEHNEDNWCSLCGCYIPAKVKVKDEKCLNDKW